ncbi:hypothetical protein [Amycolatopsis samaneae]|uniref:Lipoprotein n=1 Tax=Amycolatopsis samaneae TaxID=664691 RepID=A0ABW5GPJ3_9PSEU
MKMSQSVRPFRRIPVLLGATLAMTGLAAGTASAAGPGAANHLQSPASTHGARVAGVTATTCTASVGAPVRAGASDVALDYRVNCDQEVVSIGGFVAIFRGAEQVPLGGTTDPFVILGLGGGNQIKRRCASGILYGKMDVVVNFKTGEPKQISRTFFGPASRITC